MKFELVTPAKSLAKLDAIESVYIPGSEGEFGVLPGHQAFLSTLQPGLLKITHDAGQKTTFVIGQGFVDVNPEAVTVLTEEAVAATDIDLAKSREELKTVEATIQQLENLPEDARRPQELALAQREQTILRLQIELASA